MIGNDIISLHVYNDIEEVDVLKDNKLAAVGSVLKPSAGEWRLRTTSGRPNCLKTS